MIHRNTKIHFLFIRHGEAESNLKPELIVGRSPDATLSDRGREQARALGRRLKNERTKVHHMYSSSLPRAIQTSEDICNEMDLPGDQIVQVEDLVEFSQGQWEGKPREQVYTHQNLNQMNTKGYLFVPPGGESQRMVERRASHWLEDTILYDPDTLASEEPVTIAVVAHGIVLKCIFHYVMGFNDRLIYRIQLDNCSLSRFTFKKDGWFINSINDTAHLGEIGRVSDPHAED